MGGLDSHQTVGGLETQSSHCLIQLFNAFCVVSDRELGQNAPILGVTDADIVLVVGPINTNADHRQPPGFELGPDAGRPYRM